MITTYMYIHTAQDHDLNMTEVRSYNSVAIKLGKN